MPRLLDFILPSAWKYSNSFCFFHFSDKDNIRLTGETVDQTGKDDDDEEDDEDMEDNGN